MNNVLNVMFALLRYEICGEAITEEVKNHITPEILPELLTVSKGHDLAHLVGDALYKNGLVFKEDESYKVFEQLVYMSIIRYENQNYEFKRICKTLEQNKIPFIPLKGSVIRQYYPEPWMRTSCDIDILVKPCDLDRATNVLADSLKYTVGKRDFHDITLYAPSGVHLELHFDMVEDGRANNAKEILASVWDNAICRDESFQYSMSDEMFYFYHIAHMAKHFEIGGCGVRPFLDLWVLHNKRKAKDTLLEAGGLLRFANAVTELSNVWFSQKTSSHFSDMLGKYILGGGVYGNLENRVLIGRTKQGGKLKYIIKRVFLPFSSLKNMYPVIQSKPWLTPIFELVRWGNLLFNGGIKKSVREFGINESSIDEQTEGISDLLEYLGL